MSEKNRPTNTEWILIIILIVLLHIIINYIANDFAKSGRALGYVSLAGTVVSIMLGLIAIIYSFVQSVTHSNSVSEMRGQVQRLTEAGEKITTLENNLENSAKEIAKATASLTLKIHENTEETKRVTERLVTQEMYAKGKGSGEHIEENDRFGGDWHLIEMLNLMIYDIVRLKLSVNKFGIEYLPKLFSGDDSQFNRDFYTGGLAAHSMHLSELNVIELNKRTDENGGIYLNKGPGYEKFETYVLELKAAATNDESTSYIAMSKRNFEIE